MLRNLDNKRKWLLVFVLVSAIAAAYVLPRVFGQGYITFSGDKTVLAWLESNRSVLDLSGDLSSFQLMDDALDGKVLFLTGENHGKAMNEDLELGFFKYLHQQAGVRYLLVESGYASAALTDRYIQTGEVEYLDKVFVELKGTYSWTKERYAKWQQLRAWNETLPEDERINVIGIDIEHQPRTAVWYLHTLLPEGDAPQEIAAEMGELIASCVDSESLESHEISNLIDRLSSTLQQNRAVYESWLGEKSFDFALVVDNILTLFEAHNSGEFMEVREEQIVENFHAVYGRHPGAKFFGQWGGAHIQSGWDGARTPLVGQLEQAGSPVAGKILTIQYYYTDCRSLTKGSKGYGEAPVTTIKDKHGLAQGSATLYKLTGGPDLGPAFTGGDYPPSPKDHPFMVIIKGSKASTPFK